MKVPPVLLIRIEVEGSPCAIVLAGSLEDEWALCAWATSPRTRRGIIEAVEDALDELSQKRAA